MELTQEQKDIINALKSKNKIRIHAFAGTGKTTTLLEIVKAFPNKRFLYLAFNKSIQTEAYNKFPKRNVVIKTTHALAYQFVGKNYKIENINAVKISDLFGMDYQTAYNILQEFETFCNSDYYTFEECNLEYKDYVKLLYNKMKNKEIPANHSFYLKEFQLALFRREIQLKYDIVLLDEAQDTNPVTISIFDLINADKKVIVGDTHQQIYAFRGAVNALEKFEGEKYYLTHSFRFNEMIGKISTYFLNVWKNEDKEIKGVSTKTNIETKAIISRTNSKLIYEANFLIEDNKKFKLVRNPYNVFALALNVLKLKNKEDLDKGFTYLNKFKYIELLDMVDDDEFQDIELKTAVKIVEEFDNKLKRIYAVATDYFNNNNLKPEYYLTTGHTAKGLEWDEVKLSDDFNVLYNKIVDWFKMKGIKRSNRLNPYSLIKTFAKNKELPVDIVNEINLFYVAMTRAKVKLINKSDVTFKKQKINDKILDLMF